MSVPMHTGLVVLGLLTAGAIVYVPIALWALRTARGLFSAVARGRRPEPDRRERPRRQPDIALYELPARRRVPESPDRLAA